MPPLHTHRCWLSLKDWQSETSKVPLPLALWTARTTMCAFVLSDTKNPISMLQTCSNWFNGSSNWIISNARVQWYVYLQTLFALTYTHRLLHFDSVLQAAYHIKAHNTKLKCLAWHLSTSTGKTPGTRRLILCFEAYSKPNNKLKISRGLIRNVWIGVDQTRAQFSRRRADL